MKAKEILKVILDAKKEAIKLFGEYTYQDKGPSEVMDVDALETMCKAESIEEVGEALKQLHKKDKRLYKLLGMELCEQWPEFETLVNKGGFPPF